MDFISCVNDFMINGHIMVNGMLIKLYCFNKCFWQYIFNEMKINWYSLPLYTTEMNPLLKRNTKPGRYNVQMISNWNTHRHQLISKEGTFTHHFHSYFFTNSHLIILWSMTLSSLIFNTRDSLQLLFCSKVTISLFLLSTCFFFFLVFIPQTTQTFKFNYLNEQNTRTPPEKLNFQTNAETKKFFFVLPQSSVPLLFTSRYRNTRATKIMWTSKRYNTGGGLCSWLWWWINATFPVRGGGW